MRKMLLITLTLLSFNSFANQDFGLRICENIFNSAQKQNCIREVMMGQYYSNRAVMVIEQFFYLEDKIAGLRAIRNKKYSQAQVNTCTSFFTIFDKVQCFGTSGTDYRRGNGNGNSRIRRQINNAINAIEDGSDRRAIRILERLLDQLR